MHEHWVPDRTRAYNIIQIERPVFPLPAAQKQTKVTSIMHIGILTCTVSLPGCSSLKEKRQRMGGLHERLGRNPAIAVCESGERDRHDLSEWSFVVVGLARKEVEALYADIENKLERAVDGRIVEIAREML